MTSDAPDSRLYVPEIAGWRAQIKTTWDKFYCFAKNPGEEYYHLLLQGEIFLQHGDEMYCLNCARRMGIVTTDRQFWQKSVSDIRIEAGSDDGPVIPLA